MSNYTATDNGRSLGSIVKDLTADISNLVRSEIELFKLEMKQSATRAGGGIAFLVIALFLALVALAFLFVTITLGLVALGVPAWLSALIVTVVLFIAAGIFAMLGKKKLEGTNFVPTEAIEHVKGDIDSLKSDVARVRSR